MKTLFLFISVFIFVFSSANAQSVEFSKDFRLGSPNTEPDGRKDVVVLPDGDFVALSKVSGSAKGKAEFALERYNTKFETMWSVSLWVENNEEYKDIFFNGKDIVLLSGVHLKTEGITKLEAYGYDVEKGGKIWTKELDKYQVGQWDENPHKGKVKESFIDVIIEHNSTEFVTAFEYTHHLEFSPDGSKFISYVFNYGEHALTANVGLYDNSGNLLKKGKVGIDNDYVNYGMYINNKGDLFILNANNGGKVNFIKFDMDTKDFNILELPSTNFQKDDFHVRFLTDDKILVGNTELNSKGMFAGVMFSIFDFSQQKVEKSIFKEYDEKLKAKHLEARKNSKLIKGEENWLDYDLTHFGLEANGQLLFVLEKRCLYADGYPHISRGTFDESHKVELDGHVQAEGIIMMSFNSKDELQWSSYLAKNQVYPAIDGLNSISFAMDNMQSDQIRFIYAYSDGLDASIHKIRYLAYDRDTGAIIKDELLPNPDKLVLVRDYTIWPQREKLVLVGRKGLLGKVSVIVSYKI
ncbi:MAG TPA: hypothetical protein VK750_00565 [Cytophagaceae bacterium]|jgi:hypothetical protein|nr:hypothetical protein [Cytophagaceae bacterium]